MNHGTPMELFLIYMWNVMNVIVVDAFCETKSNEYLYDFQKNFWNVR